MTTESERIIEGWSAMQNSSLKSFCFLKCIVFVLSLIVVYSLIKNVYFDYRPLKLEQYYPDIKQAEAAVTAAIPLGSTLDKVISIMHRSDIDVYGGPSVHKAYKEQNHSENELMFVKRWSEFSEWSVVEFQIAIEFDKDFTKVTKVRVNYSKTKFGI